MNEFYYNVAADLICRLIEQDESCVMQHTRKNLKDVRKNIHESNVSELESRLQKLADEISFCLKKENPFHKNKLTAAITFLMILDYFSANEWITNRDNNRLAQPLNSELRENIEIIPTVPGVDRTGSSYDKLECIFENLIFLKKDTEFEKLITVKNYYLETTNESNSIKIGFAPYPCDSDLPYEIIDNKVKGKQKTKLTEADVKYIDACEELIANHGCNLIFGPEMYGSPLLDAELKNQLKANSLSTDISAIICPSYHRDFTVGEKVVTKNITTVYIRQKPHIKKAEVEKIFGADFNGGPTEGITYAADETEHSVILLHIKNVGRVLIFICKDFITPAVNKLIEKLNADIVLIQCYTEVLTDFHQYADKILRKRVILLGNSCHACKKIVTEEGCNIHPFLFYTYNNEHGRAGPPTIKTSTNCSLKCNFSFKKCCKILKINKVYNNNKSAFTVETVQ